MTLAELTASEASHYNQLQQPDTQSQSVQNKTNKQLSRIAGKLLIDGPEYRGNKEGDPSERRYRPWSSRNPNVALANLLASSGALATDDQEYEEALAALESWRWKPWKGFVSGSEAWISTNSLDGHWEPLAAPSCPLQHSNSPQVVETLLEGPAVSVEVSEAVRTKHLSVSAINEAFEQYASPSGNRGNLEAALFAFAGSQGRLKAASNLLASRETFQEPEDVIADFYVHLRERFFAGDYAWHNGKLHHWIGRLWGWFFAKSKRRFYTEVNSTSPISRGSKVDLLRKAGETFLSEVDFELSTQQPVEDVNDPARQIERLRAALTNPDSEWSKLSDTSRQMIADMMAGKLSSISNRHQRREISKIRAKPALRQELLAKPRPGRSL